MKRIYIILLIISTIFTGVFISNFFSMHSNSILSTNEINDIYLLREEEKLARDIYLEFYDIYRDDLFLKLSQDEEIHMAKVLEVIDKYNLNDPIKSNISGIFTNKKYQDKYIELIVKGSKSLDNAILIGAKLEKGDIQDISEFKLRTENYDVISRYNFLQIGSKAHLKQFNYLLSGNLKVSIKENTFSNSINNNLKSEILIANKVELNNNSILVFNDNLNSINLINTNILSNAKIISGNLNLENENSILLSQNNWAFSKIIFKKFKEKKIVFNFKLKTKISKNGENGYVIFDYKNPQNFKYVGLNLKREYFVIAQYINKSTKISIIKKEILKPQKDFNFDVEIDGGKVLLYVDSKLKLKKEFPKVFEGNLGFAVFRANSTFENISIFKYENSSKSKISQILSFKPSSNSGLDEMTNIILNDEGLNKRIPRIDILEAAYYSDITNKLILDAIKKLQIADDEIINSSEVVTLNKYLYDNYYSEWKILHGNDNNGYESGFHLVQNDGATTKLFNKNAINTIIDGTYHLGFEPTNRNNAKNEDGNNNQNYKEIAKWLNYFLKYDLKSDSLKSEPYLKAHPKSNFAKYVDEKKKTFQLKNILDYLF